MKTNKIAVVTGVTDGIGKRVALGLITQGYRLLVIARNENKFRTLHKEALSIDEGASLTFYQADLCLVSSTRHALAKISADVSAVDVLYQSAGLIPGKIELTEEGIEKTFAVSYLTRYLISKELMPLILQSEQKLFVNMAGAGQKGTIHFDDINFSTKKFRPMNVVKQFQQANDVLSTYLMQKYHSEGLRVYCLMPGLVDTGIHDGWPPVFRFLIKKILGSIAMVSAEKASEIPRQIILGSIHPDGVLVDNRGKAIQPSATVLSSAYQQRLIALSEKMIDV